MTAFRKWPGITSSPSTSYLRYLAGHFEDGKSIAKTEEVYNGYVSELQKADSYWQFKLETLDGQILTGLCFHEEPAAELQLSFEKKSAAPYAAHFRKDNCWYALHRMTLPCIYWPVSSRS